MLVVYCWFCIHFFFFKQKTAYEMRISDWSSDVCSSDLLDAEGLVISSNQRGFRIAPISIDDLQDLTSVRIDVEINCLKHSLRLGDLGWETNLVAAFHRLSKTATPDKNGPDATAGTYTLAHDDFHGALVAGCDSVWLDRKSTRLNSSH